MVVRQLAKDGADVVGVDISLRLLETAPRLEASERLGIAHVVDRVAEPPADRDWANKRPGTAGTPIYLVVWALGPPSPAV
jgi:hypothetical protein